MNAAQNFTTEIAPDFFMQTENTEDGPMAREVQVFTILSVASNGRVFALHNGTFAVENNAREVLAALDHNPETNPAEWLESYPIYGSAAWDQEAENDLKAFD